MRTNIIATIALAMIAIPSAAQACSCGEGPFTMKDFAGSTVLEMDIGSKTWGSMLCGISRSYESRTAIVKRVVQGEAPPSNKIVLTNRLSFRPGYCTADGSACQYRLTPGVRQMVVTREKDGTYQANGICSQFAWTEARNHPDKDGGEHKGSEGKR